MEEREGELWDGRGGEWRGGGRGELFPLPASTQNREGEGFWEAGRGREGGKFARPGTAEGRGHAWKVEAFEWKKKERDGRGEADLRNAAAIQQTWGR